MEKQIKKIIYKNIKTEQAIIRGSACAAKEIAIHMILFTEWCIEWVYFEEPNYYLIILKDSRDKPLGTLLEVYQYWLTNCQNK